MPRAERSIFRDFREVELLFFCKFLRGGLDLRIVLSVLDLLLDTIFDGLFELCGKIGETIFQGITKDSRLLCSSRSTTLALAVERTLFRDFSWDFVS